MPVQIVLDEPAHGVIVERDQPSCIADKSLARERQIGARLASPQQRNSKLPLETFHLHADSRLRAMEG